MGVPLERIDGYLNNMLNKCKLIQPEYIKPKNVGLMFFSMEPEKFFPYTQILEKMARRSRSLKRTRNTAILLHVFSLEKILRL